MINFIIGFFLGATAGIVLMCLVQVAKDNEEEENKTEEIDYTTVYLNGFYTGEDKWKNKIKNRISELGKENEENPDTYRQVIIIDLENLMEEK